VQVMWKGERVMGGSHIWEVCRLCKERGRKLAGDGEKDTGKVRERNG